MEIVGTDKYGFELRTCTRCQGGGHYSRNSAGDTTCYGCDGTGTALTPAAGKAKVAWKAANLEAGGILAKDVKAGMQVILNGRRLAVKTDATEPRVNGRSKIGTGDWEDRWVVSFESTSGAWHVDADMVLGTPGIHVDPAPFAEGAKAKSRRKA